MPVTLERDTTTAEDFLNDAGWVLMADIGKDRNFRLIEHWVVSKTIDGTEVVLRAASLPEVVKRAIYHDANIEYLARYSDKSFR
jgi:hypothetical protein